MQCEEEMCFTRCSSEGAERGRTMEPCSYTERLVVAEDMSYLYVGAMQEESFGRYSHDGHSGDIQETHHEGDHLLSLYWLFV